MKSEFLLMVNAIAAERQLPREVVISAFEQAIASALKGEKDLEGYNLVVRLDGARGELRLYAEKRVVEKVEDPRKEISLQEARQRHPNAQVGDTVLEEVAGFQERLGRIIAQKVRQIFLQRLKDAERELLAEEFTRKLGELVSGRIERIEGGTLVVSVGRGEGLVPREEQVPTERYRPGQTLYFYVKEVRKDKGVEPILSRSAPELVKRLLELEVPEIANGLVEVRAVAREPGSRSKVAVMARDDRVDPVGACVGRERVRISAVIRQLQGERVDIVEWDRDPARFIAKALSPAEVLRVELRPEDRFALVVVADHELPRAIGAEGQNVRLAVRLTGWRIKVLGASEYEALKREEEARRRAEEEARRQAEEARQAEARAVATEPPAPVEEEEAEAPAPEAPEEVPVGAASAQAPGPSAEAQEEEELDEEALLRQWEEEERALRERMAGPSEAVVEQEEEKEVEEAEEELELDEELWSITRLASGRGSGIRFAEDILPERYADRRGGERRKGKRGKRKARTGREPAGPHEEEF